jgi:hypothetical protein
MNYRNLLLALPLALSGIISAHAQTRHETADTTTYALNHVQLSGSHNTYDKGNQYEYLSNALLNDVQAVEIDVWTNFGSWRVSHNKPLANVNNCPKSGQAGQPRNQDLRSCVDNIAIYHRTHPGHPLIIVKLEMKNGFSNNAEPHDLDNLIADIQGGGRAARIPERDLYTPLMLMCKIGGPSCRGATYPTPEAALAAKSWPTLNELRGKVMFLVTPGTVSPNAPYDYAEALANGKARLAWPVMEVTDSSDQRTQYYGPLAAWNVIFDVQSGRLDNGAVSRAVTADWARRHFLLAVNDDTPGGPNADFNTGRARLHQLGRDFHANLVNTDQERSGIPASFVIH